MGLHLCYVMALDAVTLETTVVDRLNALRQQAVSLPFEAVSHVVRLTDADLAERRPLHGLSYIQIEDVVQISAVSTREVLYCRQLGKSEDDCYTSAVKVPANVSTLAIGFAVAPGRGCEPAAFGVTAVSVPTRRRSHAGGGSSAAKRSTHRW